MNDKTKVNTNNSDLSSEAAKNLALGDERFIGHIETPYGQQSIERGGAKDQATMRARQMRALLMVMMTESTSAQRLFPLSDIDQESLLWLGVQISDEMLALVDLVIADAKEA